MPGPVRKILIFAAVDGLILQPLAPRGQRPATACKISYKDHSILPVAKYGYDSTASESNFEAFGIIGLLSVSNSSFLVSITRRQQVAQIQGKPIFVISEITITPLSSREEADASVAHTQEGLKRKSDSHEMDESDTEADEGDLLAADGDEVEDLEDDEAVPSMDGSIGSPGHKKTSSVAEDVMARKGGYGRFAQKWFSKKGWTVGQRRNLGMTSSQIDIASSNTDSPTEQTRSNPSEDPESDNKNIKNTSGPRQKVDRDAQNLLPKLLRTTQMLFGSSRSFFFSYDHDISRSLSEWTASNSGLPLYKQFNPMFFWNRHIIQPFIDAGQTCFVLPLLQGFVGQKSFEMDLDPPLGLEAEDQKLSMEMVDLSTTNGVHDTSDILKDERQHRVHSLKPFLITLISRRSINRAGLRYLRRGVDDDGNTANSVETEQMLSDPSWNPKNTIYSFIQIRGSIPIFFSQSPYSFKPVPQLQHPEETNYQALVKHFKEISSIYGSIQIASLVEKHGPEAIVGAQYENLLRRLNEAGGVDGSPIGFEWFDFHAICRGMKFENVSLLMETIGKKLDSFGYTVEVDGQYLERQQGVLRTNCMDCLDRTNVVQSACSRRVLELQLKDEGIDMSLQVDQTTPWYNNLWADNGDSISKQYASTAAMKGDFTRTRKRDLQGAFKDMGISISRFYSSIVNDYFSQAAIDYLLGNVTSVVFDDFEANLMSADPGISMQKLRQQAIEISQRLVVADEHEELVGGWTLLTPQVPNTIKSSSFEESILLLTDFGIYTCWFDWNTEKVSSFQRIDLQHIKSIKYGTYITSTLSAAQTDERRNVGFLIRYKAGEDDITRVNTRSLFNIQPRPESNIFARTSVSQIPAVFQNLIKKPATTEECVLALKVLPTKSTITNGQEESVSEIEQMKDICSQIERMVLHRLVLEAGSERKSIMENETIISLSEAQKSTGLFEQLVHSIKKLVWA